MAGVTISLEGAEELQAALANLTEDMQEAVEKVVMATGLEIQGDIKKRIQRGPASGRTYQKYTPRRQHTASAPGEAPATDTGRLANSITFKQEGQFTVSVFSLLSYAQYLEFGTFKIAPRPSWVPATEEAAPKYHKRMEAALAREIR